MKQQYIEEIRKFESIHYANGATSFCNFRKAFLLKPGETLVGTYLFTFYPGLNNSYITEMQRQLPGFSIPNSFLEFLRSNNGINLFANSVSIFGFGMVMRNGLFITCRDPNEPLPIHLPGENAIRRKEGLVVGSFLDAPVFLRGDGSVEVTISLEKLTFENIDCFLNWSYEKLFFHYNSCGVVDRPVKIGKTVFNQTII